MRLSTDATNAAIDAVTARLAGGSLRLYAGDDPDTAQLLVELTWPSPAFPPAVNGTSVSYPLAAASALVSGNPTLAEAVTAAGATVFVEQVNQGEDSLQIEPAWIETGGAVVVDHIAYSA